VLFPSSFRIARAHLTQSPGFTPLAVIIWDCNGQTNQQWNVNATGTITGVAAPAD